MDNRNYRFLFRWYKNGAYFCPKGLFLWARYMEWDKEIGEDGIVEQCTGQKDKHGELIFEGDVLKCGDVSPLLPVSFVDGAFVYTYGNMGNYQLRKEVLVNCEIIGTIHDDQFRDLTKKVRTSMSPAAEGRHE
jgi:hypothetical protein